MSTTEEVRAWARRCADVTRGRLAEAEVWELIAERGQEWPLAFKADGTPYRGGPMMKPRFCFTNAAKTVLGLTAFDPEGCHYAEGFAQRYGTWFHHAWVVNAYGLVIERTWRGEPWPARYVGVTVELGEFGRVPGLCQLADWPLDTPWGPDLEGRPAEAGKLFAS
jgi:hypothetical protein